jgi:hypothetical protein
MVLLVGFSVEAISVQAQLSVDVISLKRSLPFVNPLTRVKKEERRRKLVASAVSKELRHSQPSQIEKK